MAKNGVTTVSDAVYKLQLALLDGIEDENLLFSAGSLMSRSDYEDVVTERSISNMCGYPLCHNALPSERPSKGHYRISLKEHKVYDLHESYMYCCSSCLISSRAFAGSLEEERCSVLKPEKVNEILGLFENLGLESKEGLGNDGDLGLLKLTIQEKMEIKGEEVCMEEWIGPSNAIEGYVPRRDHNSKPSSSRPPNKGAQSSNAKSSKHDNTVAKAEDFKIAIIPNDEYTHSKTSGANSSSKPVQSNVAKEGSNPKKSCSKKGKESIFGNLDFMSTIITEDEYSISKFPSSQVISDPNQMCTETKEELKASDAEKQLKLSRKSSDSTEDGFRSSMHATVIVTGSSTNENAGLVHLDHGQNDASSGIVHMKDESPAEAGIQSSKKTAKSSLRTSGVRKSALSVTWADEEKNGCDGGNLCEVRELKNRKDGPRMLRSKEAHGNEDSKRITSAVCAIPLSQVAEAVASGQSDITDAVSEAGIVLQAWPQEADEGDHSIEDDALEMDTAPLKWPRKPGNLNSDSFDSGDSWLDAPPERFKLTLSPFATMWNALFSWMTSSSLAYIYGRDESSHEDYVSVNGREYPSKVVLPDGRSTEIKRTLAGCLAQALPGIIAVLKLPTPISTLEQGLASLLETMSFVDALPPFRLKQWQVIVLLFLDALSIYRIPGLTSYLTSRRILIPKILNGAQISAEDYEFLKDLVIPLGRVPQFSMQSGG